jgi:hypothetical protein
VVASAARSPKLSVIASFFSSASHHFYRFLSSKGSALVKRLEIN